MPQDKTLWKNNTASVDPEQKGFIIGVSVYDQEHKQTRQPLMPGETVWLTEDERILTANAPRLEQDNPFTNGHLLQVNEEQRPIGRSIGGSTTTTGETVAPVEDVEATAAAKAEADAPPADPAPEPEAPAAPEDHTVAPPSGPPVGTITELPPELRLGGDNDTEAGEPPEVSGPVSVVGDGEVREVAEEEHAAVGAATVAEETGAAVPPAGEPPIGEYAQDEEVATPEAAAATSAEGPPPASPDPIDQEQGLHALTPEPEPTPENGPGGRFRVK
ncbi:MAG: hypothetical protein QOF36_2543 [Microbacteriaceae bacterium]|nr:hypothetical protein [Microbacteriaceae bacterium]